ncbi:MAG TPA: hypothetical protein VE974_14590 [Thermoanaerobaculia bacterium]|nr:hypothetical protein [Thermoanaerobaculia bacterium]
MTLGIDAVEKRVREVESGRDLLRFEVDGCCIWPLFRYDVLRTVAAHQVGGASRGRLSRAEVLRDTVAGLRTFLLPPRVRHVVRTQASGLSEKHGDLYRDIWFDDLLASIGSFVKLDAINNPEFAPRRRHAALPAASTIAGFERIAGVVRRLAPSKSAAAAAAALHGELARELGETAPAREKMQSQVQRFSASRAVYRHFLRRIRPRYLLIEWAVASPLVAAARDEGIQVVEFQHGIMRGSFSAYSWPRYALPYKERMPVPDRIFVYGDYWAEELRANGFWGDALRVVGSPRHDRYRRVGAETAGDAARTLLVTTQGIDVQNLISFLVRSLEHARANGVRMNVVIKAHPTYEGAGEVYRTAFAAMKEVRVVGAGEEPSTFQLLMEADAHASISSACHYDAIGVGVPTIILGLRMHEIVLPLHAAGHAALAMSPEKLVELMAEPSMRLAPSISGYYFQPHAVANMRRELGLAEAQP